MGHPQAILSPIGAPVIKRGGVRARAIIALVCLAILSAGCQTRATVEISVHPNGSGTITIDVYLDPQAAAQVGDLKQVLAVDDLRKAGWTIFGPGPASDVAKQIAGQRTSAHGRVSSNGFQSATVLIHLQHPFRTVDQANQLLTSLNGPDGPFKGVKLAKSSSFFSSKVQVSGTVDLSRGLDAFSDPALTKSLGAPLSEVVSKSGGPVPFGKDLTVALEVVPVKGQSWHGNVGNSDISPQLIVAQTSLGASPHSIDVTSTTTHRIRIVLLAIVGFGVVAIAALLITAPARRKRRSASKHARRR